jgi:hypothetical protein
MKQEPYMADDKKPKEEDLTPTPTQAENDAAKLAAMPGEKPDEEKRKREEEEKRKNAEAGHPATYTTREHKPK